MSIKHRLEFTATLTRELPTLAPHIVVDLARAIMRLGATLQRLAEAQCNGDYPYFNGSRLTWKSATCSQCEAECYPGALRKGGQCPDCRAQATLTALVAPYGIVPYFQGDPRGCVVKLRFPRHVAEGTDKYKNPRNEGICVPA